MEQNVKGGENRNSPAILSYIRALPKIRAQTSFRPVIGVATPQTGLSHFNSVSNAINNNNTPNNGEPQEDNNFSSFFNEHTLDLSVSPVPLTRETFESFRQEDLIKVKCLDCSLNKLSTLSASILPFFLSIEQLNLRNNNLTSLPNTLGDLSCLTELNLERNFLEVLPRSLGQNTGLVSLNLNINRLCSLPTTIGQLINLRILLLRSNKIVFLNNGIKSMQSLEHLDLSYNMLESLPPEIGQLSNLKFLNLSYNSLREIPYEVYSLTNLQTLSIRYNNLNELSPRIGQLQNLTSFDLSHNNFISLPPEISSLSELKTLHVEYQNISQFPTFSSLQKLTDLSISGNALTSFPSDILTLTNLMSLNLRCNCLSFIPPEVAELPSLQLLDVFGNPCTYPLYKSVNIDLSNHIPDIKIIHNFLRNQTPSTPLIAQNRSRKKTWRPIRQIMEWDMDEIARWLESIQLPQYTNIFYRHKINGRILVELTEKEFKENLYVLNQSHITRMLQLIQEERSRSFSEVSPSPPFNFFPPLPNSLSSSPSSPSPPCSTPFFPLSSSPSGGLSTSPSGIVSPISMSPISSSPVSSSPPNLFKLELHDNNNNKISDDNNTPLRSPSQLSNEPNTLSGQPDIQPQNVSNSNGSGSGSGSGSGGGSNNSGSVPISPSSGSSWVNIRSKSSARVQPFL